jgi:hypothetical protein
MDEIVKLVVYVPVSDADKVRESMGTAGAGKLSSYSFCTFSVKGTGRFKPEKGADPAIGKVGELTEVEEERIETICFKKDLYRIIKEIKKVHPYEEVVMDIYPLVIQPQDITENEEKKDG